MATEVMADAVPAVAAEPAAAAAVVKEESRRDRSRDRGSEGRRRDRDRRDDREERRDRRDRDRDYKRRKSGSPPAGGSYRDRRHSPRRSSPPYKRRRDDDFDGRRAGSPDRYGGFDGVGVYGRGRGGFRDGAYPSMYGGGPPPRRDGLMSYKQFIVELEDDVLPGEAERRYEEYKSEFITTQKRAFFEQHKDDEWLREKYDPAKLEISLVRRNENSKILSRELLAELQAGSLDLGPSVRSSGKEDAEDDVDGSSKRRKPSQEHVKAQEINAAPKAHPGFSDPKRVVQDIEQARALLKKLDAEKGIEGNLLSPDQSSDTDRTVGGGLVGPIVIVRSGTQVKGLEGTELLDVVLTYLWRVHSVDYYGMTEYKEPPKRLRHIRAVEAKTNGESKSNGEEVDVADWDKKLDTIWQARLQSGDIIISMLGREKLDTTANEALDPFVRKIRDEKYGWKYGCGAKGCTKLFHGPEFVQKHLKLKHSDLVADVVAKAREDIYFQNYMSDPDAPGANQAASSQPGQRDGDRSRREGHRQAGFPGASGGPGSRGGSEWAPTEHPPRDGRFGPRNGERFEQGTGNREDEQQRFERGGGRDDKARFDRGGPEHSPPRDYPLGAGGPPFEGGGPAQGGPFEGGPMEPPMFDHFNGPPLRGLPGGLFVPNMPGPPQVLMPVPGAGPLGPFVPAPPEMAMRFLREGPGPFRPDGFDGGYQEEGNGGPRGGKRGAPGPMMGGGLLDVPPMMMPPHGMRRDPRGVRSYHDLDAPEDEVSVIDYRSL